MKMIDKFYKKNILVLGLAKSGTEAAKLLHLLGAQVTVNDQKPYEENSQARELEKQGMTVVCGSHPNDLVNDSLDYLVKNPGIRYDHPLILEASKRDIPIITEVELAFLISEADMIGITGSNGKTTTTTYIGDMLKGGEKEPLLAGNIGEVACGVAQNATNKHEMVVELSSFQLMGIDTFSPKIAVLLNFVEAHLDYHGSMKAYIEAKMNVFKNQTEEDFLIYNMDDQKVSEVVEKGRARLIPFSTKQVVANGACIVDDWLTVFDEKLIHVSEMSLPGEHNIANGLAAAAAALLAGAKKDQVCNVLRNFAGVAHRLQFIGELNGRRFFNNSKATNVPATITALKAFEDQVVLIAGGLDRGLSFDELIPLLSEQVSTMITYGETKLKLSEAAEQAGVPQIFSVESLEEATHMAYKKSEAKDVILLSPACASWDQFKTFEERGDMFTETFYKLSQ
ncbi:UDP-N-acetylmuramoyl-L-alanine--D-glutamate ligase [Salipaludibacillus sp. HK11]|uniref:UDP-N-acetylmuramoyl-L-alanine--D-glutamate ligase n=1 Tax=Salipaludibacillus sp. HK11 TaxID=3394320 RepID=UPI0039FC7067